jgi:hypothetical protein
MKKLLTGGVCAAAIAAAAVVLLPVAAVKIALRLSKPRDPARADRPEAEEAPRSGLPLAEPHEMRG